MIRRCQMFYLAGVVVSFQKVAADCFHQGETERQSVSLSFSLFLLLFSISSLFLNIFLHNSHSHSVDSRGIDWVFLLSCH